MSERIDGSAGPAAPGAGAPVVAPAPPDRATAQRGTWLSAGDWRPPVVRSWLTDPFWDAASRGQLVVQRCRSCGAHVFRPEYACTACFAADLEWMESSGRGTIYSHSIVERPAFPQMPTPYAVVVVAMDEGWHMLSNLIDCDVADVRSGLPVEVRFVELDGTALPFFAPGAVDDHPASSESGAR